MCNLMCEGQLISPFVAIAFPLRACDPTDPTCSLTRPSRCRFRLTRPLKAPPKQLRGRKRKKACGGRYSPGAEFSPYDYTALCRHCGWITTGGSFTQGHAEMVFLHLVTESARALALTTQFVQAAFRAPPGCTILGCSSVVQSGFQIGIFLYIEGFSGH